MKSNFFCNIHAKQNREKEMMEDVIWIPLGHVRVPFKEKANAKRRSCEPHVREAQEPEYVKPHIQNSEGE